MVLILLNIGVVGILILGERHIGEIGGRGDIFIHLAASILK